MNMTTETERQLAAERKVAKKELAAARAAAGDAAWAAAGARKETK